MTGKDIIRARDMIGHADSLAALVQDMTTVVDEDGELHLSADGITGLYHLIDALREKLSRADSLLKAENGESNAASDT